MRKHNIYWVATDTVSYYCDFMEITKEKYKELECENKKKEENV